MHWRYTFAFAKRMLLHFRHDRRTLAFIIVVPLIIIALFGYTFGGDVKHVKVIVVNMDQGLGPTGSNHTIPEQPSPPLNIEGARLGDVVVSHLDTESLDITTSSNLTRAKDEVKAAHVWAVIYIPKNYTQRIINDLMIGSHVDLGPVIYVDGSNPNILGAVQRAVQSAVVDTMASLSSEYNLTSMDIAPKVRYVYGSSDLEFIDYFAPGVMAFAVLMVTVMLSLLTFVQERRQGTLERLLATPATEGDIVAGYAIAFSIIGAAQSLVILGTAIALFRIHIEGAILDGLIIILLTAIGHQGLGILLSSGARNELQAVQFFPLIVIPSILLTGLFWPVESIPKYLQPLTWLIPLTYSIDALHSIFVRGWGLVQVWKDIAVLLTFTVITLVLSVLLLKRRG